MPRTNTPSCAHRDQCRQAPTDDLSYTFRQLFCAKLSADVLALVGKILTGLRNIVGVPGLWLWAGRLGSDGLSRCCM